MTKKYILEDSSMSLIKKMEVMAWKIPDCISLSQWIPDYPMPQELINEATNLLQEWVANKYVTPAWIIELREKLSKRYQKKYSANVSVNEIVITAGAIEAINALILTIITSPEDEVIILDPNYASYNNAIKISWAKLVYCNMNDNLSFNYKNLERLINKNTKAIITSNPNNPTGLILDQDEIKQILDLIDWSGTYFVCDEVYKYFLLNDDLNLSSSAVHFNDYRKNLVIIDSWSKTFSITGWRIWYIIWNEELMSEVVKVHDSLVTCAPSIAQYAILNSLDILDTRAKDITTILIKNRDYLVQELSKLNKYIIFETPKAWYYIFPKLLYTDDDCSECMKILEEAKVSVVPGSAFWSFWKGRFRICFGRKYEDLVEAVGRLKKYFLTLKK